MGKPNLLPQQAAAVRRRGSVGLSAGAGCGKTFVLIQRFLHELDPARLKEPGPHGLASVAAITFTKKATGELLDRLREGVRDRLADPDRLAERAHWRDLARRTDAARVNTIHGFCSELLRGHAARAGLDPAFSVVEGAEAEELRDAAVAEAFKAALARDGDRAETGGDRFSPRGLVAAYGLEKAEAVVKQWLYGDPALLEEAWDAGDLADLRAAAWRTDHVPRLGRAFAATDGLRELRDLLLAHPADKPKHAAARKELAGLLGGCAAGPPPPEAAARMCELARLPAVGGKGCWPDGDVKETVGDLCGSLRKAAKAYADAAGVDPAAFLEPARLSVAFLPLARDAARRYADAKRSAAQLDQDELLRRGRDLLRDDAVRAKVAAGLRLLMVDEFQDTDPVQAEVVAALTGTNTAAAVGADAGRLFLVGDAKQSIYRFRGADPAVFDRVREALPEGARLPLTANFRSRPEILRFVNATFRPAMDGYEPLEPPPPGVRDAPPATKPCVEFLFPSVPRNGEKAASADELREVEAAWVAARVRQLVDSADRVVRDGGTERAVRPGDVCLLFRSLSGVRPYEEALRKQGLDYYLVGGRAFFTQQEVHDLIHLLLWLDEPDDTLSLAGVLRSPLCGLSDDTLFRLVEAGRDDPGLPRLASPILRGTPVKVADEQQAERLRHAGAVLRELAAARDRLSPADLLDRAVSRTGYDAAVLAEPLGDRKLANLRKLQAMARRQGRDGGPGLRGFVGRLRESVEKEVDEELAATRAEAADVVRLMTTHKAKGLEFPVVVACDCDREARAASAPLAVDPALGPHAKLPGQIPVLGDDGKPVPDLCDEMLKAREREADAAEERRVFYVAATRAADRLILSAARPVDPKTGDLKPPSGTALSVLAGAFDLGTGEPLTAGDGLFAAPPVRVHDAEPAAAGRTAGRSRRGIAVEKIEAAVAGIEPDAVFPLRRPVPPCRPASVDARGFAADVVPKADRAELDAAAARLRGAGAKDLHAFLPPDLGQPVASRVGVRADLPGGPAVTATLPRLHRRGDRWFAVGTAAATAAEVAAGGLPDRFAPLVWAWRRSLDAASGGDAVLLLVPDAGDPRLAAWDDRPDSAVLALLAGTGR